MVDIPTSPAFSHGRIRSDHPAVIRRFTTTLWLPTCAFARCALHVQREGVRPEESHAGSPHISATCNQ